MLSNRFALVLLTSLLALSGCDSKSSGSKSGAACTADSDCKSTEFCDTTAGTCVSADTGCHVDADCLSGEVCDTTSGYCTAASTPSCHQCACEDMLSAGGCANVCTGALNGTGTPNFCDGASALPQCTKCLQDNCGGLTDAPNPTDPSSCL